MGFRGSEGGSVPSRRWLKSPASQTDRRGNGVQRVRGGKCAQQQMAEIACQSDRQTDNKRGEGGSDGRRVVKQSWKGQRVSKKESQRACN